jgi:hypothetical protein
MPKNSRRTRGAARQAAPRKAPASAEHELRAIERRCRGPRTDDPTAALERLGTSRHADPLRRVQKEGRAGTTGDALSALLAGSPEDREAAGALDAATRAGCGYDLNELILAGGLDGQAHEAPCPNCGRTVRWTAPQAAE